jgi:hypothetical protein
MNLTVVSWFLISFVMEGSGPSRANKFLYAPAPPPPSIWTLNGWKKIDPGSRIRDERPDLIFENLISVFWLKNTQILWADPDLGSGILSTLDLGSGMKKVGSGMENVRDWILDKHSGSVTLPTIEKLAPRLYFFQKKSLCHPKLRILPTGILVSAFSPKRT